MLLSRLESRKQRIRTTVALRTMFPKPVSQCRRTEKVVTVFSGSSGMSVVTTKPTQIFDTKNSARKTGALSLKARSIYSTLIMSQSGRIMQYTASKGSLVRPISLMVLFSGFSRKANTEKNSAAAMNSRKAAFRFFSVAVSRFSVNIKLLP